MRMISSLIVSLHCFYIIALLCLVCPFRRIVNSGEGCFLRGETIESDLASPLSSIHGQFISLFVGIKCVASEFGETKTKTAREECKNALTWQSTIK